VSLLVAIALNGEGDREILGHLRGAKEDKAGWSAFLRHLKKRGLSGVRLVISDAAWGLAESAAGFFPEAAWQRCIMHWYRNIFSHWPPGSGRLHKASEECLVFACQLARRRLVDETVPPLLVKPNHPVPRCLPTMPPNLTASPPLPPRG
jgi:putative transposase